MATRVKHVVGADMVAHLWAHKSQDWAGVGPGRGNFYFEGDTIYSYGSHFPIARHITHKGKAAILFTTRDYSVTTAGHKHCVHSALSGLGIPAFYVYDIYAGHKEHLADYAQRIAGIKAEYAKARTRKPEILDRLVSSVAQANAYATFFGLKTRFTIPDLDKWSVECVGIQAKNEERRAQERSRQAERWKKQAQENLERDAKRAAALEAWVNGEPADFDFYNLPVRLRIKGDVLETSKGAEVPLDHAVRAFRVIKELYKAGQTYQRNGHSIHVGHFVIDSVDADGTVVAGCHRIERAEVERIATLVGVA